MPIFRHLSSTTVAVSLLALGAFAPAVADTGSGADKLLGRGEPTCHGQVATIAGTPRRDRIVGTDGDDVIVAGAGHDVVEASKGEDLVCGGAGDDRLSGAVGGDLLDGGSGEDTAIGGLGWDRLVGGRGDDRVLGGYGADTLVGGQGDDLVVGGYDHYMSIPTDIFTGDYVIGGPGHDRVFGDFRREVADPQGILQAGDRITFDRSDRPAVTRPAGSATGTTLDRIQIVDGSRLDDDLAGAPLILGGDGDDRINATRQARGGDGDDRISVRGDRTRALGQAGQDVLRGRGDEIRLDGGSGHDTLVATGKGRHVLLGSPGLDRAVGGRGREVLQGATKPFGEITTGAGGDRVVTGSLPRILDLGPGRDTLDLGTVGRKDPRDSRVLTADLARGVLRYGGTSRRFSGTLSTYRGSLVQQNRVDGDAGTDHLVGGDYADRVTGGGGQDTIDGRLGDDTLLASDRASDRTSVLGGPGRDTCRAVEVTGCERTP